MRDRRAPIQIFIVRNIAATPRPPKILNNDFFGSNAHIAHIAPMPLKSREMDARGGRRATLPHTIIEQAVWA
jgi:hypothetical protein